MTPAEQLAYLQTFAAKHPQARLYSAFDRMRIHAKAEDLKPRPWAIVRIISALAEACRIGRQA